MQIARLLLTATALATIGLHGPASAQESVVIDGVEAQRVVIAPATTDLARTIKAGLSASYAAAKPGTKVWRDAQKLYYFYGARGFEPLWLHETADGKPAFSASAASIVELFKSSHLEGLRPADYLTDAIDLEATAGDPLKLAEVETAFSAATMAYAQNLYGGRVQPGQVSGYITMRPHQIDQGTLLPKLAGAADPATILADLNPRHPEFLALRTALAKFYDGTVSQPVVVPEGKLLRPGMSDERVPVLRERLEVAPPDAAEAPESAPLETDASDADGVATVSAPAENLTYDEALVAAVKAFQTELGLKADGIIGPATVAALNGQSGVSKMDIVANMERWRWMPEDLGQFRVFVNIPEFRLAIMEGESEVYTTRVVVGKTSNQTPVFSDEIEHVVVNPYWNVPSSIASKELMPNVVGNPGYLSARNMELMSGGKVINASAVNWSEANPNSFRIRQKPGTGNALGQVKFLFPNNHDVYLHDTPSKSLFSRAYRAYSHGCVRVQNPMDFADALLQHDPKLTGAAIRGMVGGGEKWNNLATHIPVHLAYFTLRVDADGNIKSFGDVYGHNKKLIALLGE